MITDCHGKRYTLKEDEEIKTLKKELSVLRREEWMLKKGMVY